MNIEIPQSILDDISSQIEPYLRPFKEEMMQKFISVKNQMIEELENHPITIEIRNGPNASNSSGTIIGKDGNLFSFIGFTQGEDPIEPIIQQLDSSSAIFKTFQRKETYMIITIPDPQSIFSVTPMPWAEGRSWAKGIESGISGIGQFLQKEGGRSGGGVQSSGKVSKGRFKNTPYISKLLKKYYDMFSNIEGVKVKLQFKKPSKK